jgi:hypothetical protein
MRGIILQSALECYVSQGDRLACAFEDFAVATSGEAMFGLLLGGSLLLSFYVASDGSVAVPAVILTLTGAFLVPILPGQVAGIAGTVIIMGLAAGIFAGLRRYALAGAQ